MERVENLDGMTILHTKSIEEIDESIGLVSDVFKLKREEVIWKYIYNDFDLYELRKNGELVACRFMLNFRFNGVKFSQLTDASIKHRYRGKGIYRRFMDKVLNIVNTDMLFSFPNENSYRVYMKAGFEKVKDLEYKFITKTTLLKNIGNLRRRKLPAIKGIPTLFFYGNDENYIKFKITSKWGIRILWIYDMSIRHTVFLKRFLKEIRIRFLKVEDSLFYNFDKIKQLYRTRCPVVINILNTGKEETIRRKVIPEITTNLADWI